MEFLRLWVSRLAFHKGGIWICKAIVFLRGIESGQVRLSIHCVHLAWQETTILQVIAVFIWWLLLFFGRIIIFRQFHCNWLLTTLLGHRFLLFNARDWTWWIFSTSIIFRFSKIGLFALRLRLCVYDSQVVLHERIEVALVPCFIEKVLLETAKQGFVRPRPWGTARCRFRRTRVHADKISHTQPQIWVLLRVNHCQGLLSFDWTFEFEGPFPVNTANTMLKALFISRKGLRCLNNLLLIKIGLLSWNFYCWNHSDDLSDVKLWQILRRRQQTTIKSQIEITLAPSCLQIKKQLS